MIRLSALYRKSTGSHFDEDYYLGRHIPLAKETLAEYGLIRIEADIYQDTEYLGERQYFAMTSAYFPDMSCLERMHSDRVEGKLGSDVPKYTNIIPVLQVSEIID